MRRTATILAAAALLFSGCGTEQPTEPETTPSLGAGAGGASAEECDPLTMIREALDGRPWNSGYIDDDSALAHTTGDVTLHVGCGEGPYEYTPEDWNAQK